MQAYSNPNELTAAEHIAAIKHNPSASNWLKNAVAALAQRDPVDAWSDATVLAEIMHKRMQEIALNASLL
jgi:hypothetical protein